MSVAYRISVAYGDDSIDFTVERDLDPDQSATDWLVQQQWSIPAVDKTARRATVAASAREHGWMLPDGRWPAVRKGHRQVFTEGIWILDHRLVIADITEHRERMLIELGRVERAWRLSLHAGSAQGHLGTTDLGRAAGVTGNRVRQILAEPVTGKAPKASTAALQWARSN